MYRELGAFVKGQVTLDERMSLHVTYRIGGPAALFVECPSVSDLSRAISLLDAAEVPWMVIGKGSNLLVSDRGYPGAIITLGQEFSRHHVDAEEGLIWAGASTPLSTVVQAAYQNELEGFEFATGVPGTVGGAIAGNIGTRDDWIASRVVSMNVLDEEGHLSRKSADEVPWRYRRSGLTPRTVILEAGFRLVPGNRAKIRSRMERSRLRRRSSQPLDLPSAGSVFKNPKGASAGRLIEQVGLKGAHIGGAQISEKHANFIVNRGNASAQDVVDLIVLARERVREAHGIVLQPEIRFVGFEG